MIVSTASEKYPKCKYALPLKFFKKFTLNRALPVLRVAVKLHLPLLPDLSNLLWYVWPELATANVVYPGSQAVKAFFQGKLALTGFQELPLGQHSRANHLLLHHFHFVHNFGHILDRGQSVDTVSIALQTWPSSLQILSGQAGQYKVRSLTYYYNLSFLLTFRKW